MKIQEAYDKYQIPPHLQMHMIRVAGVCQLVLNSIDDPKLHKEYVIQAALLHDMGNIIKFKLDKDSDLWDLQQEFIKKYGSDEHVGTMKILSELKVDDDVIDIIEKADWPNILQDNSLNPHNILIYADMRVAPDAVTDLSSRIDDLIERNKAKGVSSDIHLKIKPVAIEMEKNLASYIDLDLITEENVVEMVDEMRQITF